MRASWMAALICGVCACSGRALERVDASAGAGGSGGVRSQSAGGASAAPAGSDTSSADSAGAAGSAGAEEETDPVGKLILNRQIDMLWVHDARFYWLADPTGFESCLRADCAGSLVSYPADFSFPAFSATRVFWPSANTVLSCPATGRVDTPTDMEVHELERVLGAERRLSRPRSRRLPR